MSTQEDSIAMLNTLVKVKLAPSKIDGVGLFALYDITKGQKLYVNMFPQAYRIPKGSIKKLFPCVRELLCERWPQIMKGSAFMYPDTYLEAYINHSDTPNYDSVNDVVLEDIKEGDEITRDYRKIENWEEVYQWLKKV